MHTFAIVLASLPALVLAQSDSLGLPSPTTLTTWASLPSVPAIPSLTGFKVLRRTEATPCPTTTTAAGLLDVLRRDEDSKEDTATVPTPTETLPESAIVEQMERLSSATYVQRAQAVGNRDLGLPILPGVLDGGSSHAASSASRAADSEVTPAASETIPLPAADTGTNLDGTTAAEQTSTFTSYSSPKVTQTDFRFDSAAVNGGKSIAVMAGWITG